MLFKTSICVLCLVKYYMWQWHPKQSTTNDVYSKMKQLFEFVCLVFFPGKPCHSRQTCYSSHRPDEESSARAKAGECVWQCKNVVVSLKRVMPQKYFVWLEHVKIVGLDRKLKVRPQTGRGWALYLLRCFVWNHQSENHGLIFLVKIARPF